MSNNNYLTLNVYFPNRSQCTLDMRKLFIDYRVAPLDEQNDTVKMIIDHYFNTNDVYFDFRGNPGSGNTDNIWLVMGQEPNDVVKYWQIETGDDRQLYGVADLRVFNSGTGYNPADRKFPELPEKYEKKVLKRQHNLNFGYTETFVEVEIIEVKADESYESTTYFVPCVLQMKNCENVTNSDNVYPLFTNFNNKQKYHYRFIKPQENPENYPKKIYLDTIVQISRNYPVILTSRYSNTSEYNNQLFKRLLALFGKENLIDVYAYYGWTSGMVHYINILERISKSDYIISNDGELLKASDNTRLSLADYEDDTVVYSDGSEEYTYGTPFNSYLFGALRNGNENTIYSEVTGNVTFSGSIAQLLGENTDSFYLTPVGINKEYNLSYFGQRFGQDHILPICNTSPSEMFDGKITIDGITYGLDNEFTVIGFKHLENTNDHYILDDGVFVNESGDKATAYVVRTDSLLSSVDEPIPSSEDDSLIQT